MRIGFYAPLKPPDHPAPSGDRRMARLLIGALQGMGHQVNVISTLRSYNRTGDPAREAEIAEQGRVEAEQLTAMWEAEPSIRPDLLFTYHVYHKAADYLGPALKERFGLPYLIAEPSVAPKRQHGPWASGYAQAGTAIHAADALLAITTLDRACLSAFAGAAKVQVLPPFLDPAPFASAALKRNEHRRSIAQNFRLPEDVPWLLAVGMMRAGDKLASYNRLAETLSLCTTSQWHMILVGGGPEVARVSAAYEPVLTRVSFTGELDSEVLADFYAASDLYVWPAVNEAYGMALLEAQAAGLPVLSVNTRGVPDIVQHGATGWLTENDSAESLAKALQHLLQNADLRADMSRAAKTRVARHLSITAAQEKLAAIFVRLGLPA